MAQPAVVDDDLVAGVSNIYVDAEERLIGLIATKTNQGLDAPAWAEDRLQVVQQYQQQAKAITDGAASAAGDAATSAVRSQYQFGHIDGTSELAEGLRVQAHTLGGRVDTQAVARLAAEARAVAMAPASGMLATATTGMQAVTLEALGPTIVGAATRRTMAQQVLNRFADQGVTGFTDTAGRRWRADSYTEMAMRTQLANARIQGHTARLQQHGQDLVVVSAHKQGCELCAPFEGQVLSLSGATQGTTVANNVVTGESVQFDVMCSVDQARDAGLFHPNCGHTYWSYHPGVTPAVFGESEPQDYKDRQDLRYLERGVRKWKRVEAAALDPQTRSIASSKVNHWQARISQHVDRTGITRRGYREGLQTGVRGVGKRVATVAERAGALESAGLRTPGGIRLGDRVQAATKPPKQLPLHRRYTADKLEQLMTDAMMEERWTDMDKLGVALDKRAAQDKTAAAAKVRAKAARELKAETDAAAKNTALEKLVDQGVDYREAYSQAYNVPMDRIMRQETISMLRQDGYRGAGFNDLTSKAYADHVAAEYIKAEAGASTHMLNAEGQAKNLDPARLWNSNDATRRKYASEDLNRYWDEHGRVSLDEFRLNYLDPVEAQRMRDARGDHHL